MTQEGILLRTNTSKENLKKTYLNSYSKKFNPIYITNTTYDCSCCNQFIYNIGNLVSLKDGILTTVWDVEVSEPYQTVANTMSKYIKSQTINDIFYTSEKRYGAYKTTQTLDNGDTINWNHFHCEIPNNLFKGNKVAELTSIDMASATMLSDSLTIFTKEAIEIV